MVNYVLGFALDTENRCVMIRKNKGPSSMIGKLNGIGGRVEEGETYLKAMVREWKEEVKGSVDLKLWRRKGSFGDSETFNVEVFFTIVHPDTLSSYTSNEEEEVVIVTLENTSEFVPNLKWMIPLILDDDVKNFRVVERQYE